MHRRGAGGKSRGTVPLRPDPIDGLRPITSIAFSGARSRVVHHNKNRPPMTAMGPGRVKTFHTAWVIMRRTHSEQMLSG
jgi:hypothetical protein